MLKRLASAVMSPYMNSPWLRRTGVLGLTYNKLVDWVPGFAAMINPFWSVVNRDDELLLLKDLRAGGYLWLDKDYASILLRESEVWPLVYLPSFSLAGLTVLDVGAGQGETADFYFKHGTAKVVCVEPSAANCALVKVNAEMNGWNVEIHQELFKLEHLSIPHDFLKMDVEGGELLLLDPSMETLGPCRMETHARIVGMEQTEALIKKFALKTYDQADMFGRDD